MDNLSFQVVLIATMSGICLLYENVALFKPTFQSSDYKRRNYPSYTVVDGIKDTNTRNHSCSHTMVEENPWWTVNLEQTYLIYSLEITNRGTDQCGTPACADRLAGFQVYVSSSKDIDRYEKLCYTNNQTSLLPLIIDVTCSPPLRGQYVTLSLSKVEALTLCEVEVYGELAGFETFSSMSNGIPTESLFSPDASAGHVDLSSPFGYHLDSTVEKLAVTKSVKGATDEMLISTFDNVLSTSPNIVNMISSTEHQVKPTIDLELIESTIEDRVYLSTTEIVPYSVSISDLSPSMWPATDPSPSVITPSKTPPPTNAGFSTVTQFVPHEISETLTDSLPDRPPLKQQNITVCNCACKNARNSTTDPFMSSILADLHIDKRNISRIRSRYFCASDDRLSAGSAGWISTLLIGLLLVGTLLSDIPKIFSDIRGNKNHKGSIKQ